MKELISFSPAFDPASKTVDFKFYPKGFQLDKLYSIVNVTKGTPIYIPGVAGYGYTDFDGTKVTLAYDTTTHDANDLLNVYYDSDAESANYALESNGNLEQLVALTTKVIIELRTLQIVLAEGLNIDDSDIDDIRQSVPGQL
jgi:hypothetical protein